MSQTSKKGENSSASGALKCTMVLFVEKTLNRHYAGSYDSLESLSEIPAFCGEINEVICYTLLLNLWKEKSSAIYQEEIIWKKSGQA